MNYVAIEVSDIWFNLLNKTHILKSFITILIRPIGRDNVQYMMVYV